jgi:hypothetical protein
MTIRERIDDIQDRIDDWYDSAAAALSAFGAAFVAVLKHEAFLAWLTFLAAAASAAATGFSYFAAKKSAEVARQAQSFSERTNREQLALGRPVLSVMGGRLDSWFEESGYSSKKTMYRLELTVHNSGVRTALPAWIGLFQRDRTFDDRRALNQSVWPIAVQLADIPSGSDVKVIFDLGESHYTPADWTLALAYGDETPDGRGDSGAASEKLLQRLCSPAKVVVLHAAKSPASAASGPSDWAVTSATPVLMDRKAMESGGKTQAEAVGLYMEKMLADDARCAAGAASTPQPG